MKRKSKPKNVRAVLLISIMLFALWIVFTMKFNWEHLLMGAVVSIFIGYLTGLMFYRKMDASLSPKLFYKFPVFFGLLAWEIIKANVDVLRRVFAPSMPISPRIISFDSFLETDLARVVLSNSITLTPGTVTIDIEGSRLYVHCLAGAHQDDLLQGRLERMVAWLFSEGPADKRRLR
ncbi:MAG: Na+/H+ antiporter subunit E [Actinobacteria bacterium]|nr:Na+/H+ antiporter subunit E [Actinomycetota bacterium]